ncbi:zf-HC2 domain-containing protein [Micromonospora sp. R77]|uniref:zf-HC2 domain-containing protein n=1 Tax=Micromonospora sp. R77 TaxID=2925836 RepID=UPI001F605CD6|nr:zf-HC2 domain-containing protein [Micromonospora sp. R77]MCI4061379.1 zf-HC2 domain-containing protein [Micromonospora sp. R77]
MTDHIGDAHVEESTLGSHFLGELSPAESDAIHRHLQDCDSCRTQADAVVDAIALLELADLAAELGVITEPPARDSHPAPVLSSRPPGRTGKTGPVRSRTRGKRTRLVRLGSLLAVALVVAGLGLSALVRGPGTPDASVTTVTVNATAKDDRSGATVSIFLTGLDDGGTRVRATVVGLKEGDKYVLYAVTANGTTHRVVQWLGQAGVQDVTGDLAGVDVGDLSYFTVSRDPSGTVVSVHLTSAAGKPRR